MFVFQTTENQEVMWLPTNADTRTLQYDTCILKSSEGRMPPLKWSITKIEDSAVDGIARFTLAQTQYDAAKDNAELMIADYYTSYVEPDFVEIEETPTISLLEIVHTGKAAVRAGGGFKKFTLKARVDGNLIDTTEDVEWSINFPDGDITKLETSVEDNIFRVKCLNDYSLIGKTFTITAESEHNSESIIVEVISL